MLLQNMVCKYSLAYFYSEWNVLGKGEMFMMQENKQKIARANPLRTQESNWRSWPDRKGGQGQLVHKNTWKPGRRYTGRLVPLVAGG